MINSLPNMDPESYAKQYASENNISVEEARTQLKAKYGDPKAQSDNSIFDSSNEGEMIGTSLALEDLNLEDDEEIGSMTIKQLLMAILGLLRGIMGNAEDEDEDFDEYVFAEDVAVNVEDTLITKEDEGSSYYEIIAEAYEEAENTTSSKISDSAKTTKKKSSSKKTSSKKTDNTTTTDKKKDKTEKTKNKNSEKTKDDYYKTVADKCGLDRLTVSAIAKAVADGSATGKPEEVVPKLAYDLGLPQSTVSKVLKYLNNGTI